MGLQARLTAAMVALVVLTAATVGLLIYRNVETVVLPRALGRIDAHARLLAAEFEATVRSARADVLGFLSAYPVLGIVEATLAGGFHPVDGATPAQWGNRLAARLTAELAAKPTYHQFRLIAADGHEIVRVDRSGRGGAIRVLPAAELQDKGDRDYFQRAIRLSPGEVDISPVRLNQERGVIETPHVPVFSAATPFFARDKPFGIIIIDVDLRTPFAQMARAALRGAKIFVVNEAGDYLLHPDAGRVFGFELGKSFRVQDDFPAFDHAGPAEAAEPRVLQDRAGALFGVAAASVRLAGGPRVTVIETVPNAEVVAALTVVRDSSLLAGVAAVLGAALLAVFIARSLSRPLRQMTAAADSFARGEAAPIPTDASGEIGVLARAFARMTAEVQEKTAALTKEIAQRRRLFETSLDLILISDRQGNLAEVNPSCRSILGYAPEEMIGHSAIEFIYPEDLENTRNEMRAGRRGLHMRNFDCRYVHRDGRVVALSWTGVWSEPEQRHFFIGRDMTERIKLEQQLRQSQKMDAIGHLTGGVAHDFNNILTVIIGTIEILAQAVADRPQLAAVARMIDEAATRGAALTQQLLAFARRQPLQPRTTDINALVVETVKMLRPTLGERIEIESMLEDDAWPVDVDPSQLGTALLNLAVNARDAMPDGGMLTLETGNVVLDESYAAANSDVAPGPYVLIAVSDSGTGIPAEIRDKVFEPFFTTKDVGKGTGLGLSMVYGFVKQSGGHIKIYSEDNHGTSVKLYLPRAAAQADQPAEAPIATFSGGYECILVVEDDALVRKYVIAQLESLGYATIAAADAVEALRLIEQGAKIDLLFTDVIMPGTMNGRQLAHAILARRPGVKVLYTSGYTENAIIHHGRLDPGVALLNKPYRKTDLARKIREVLDAPVSIQQFRATQIVRGAE
jgi:PAS domain S-box-containing protein